MLTTINLLLPHPVLTDIKGKINSMTVILGDINAPLTSMDKPSRQKINKEAVAYHDTLDQMDLIDIFEDFTHKQQNIQFLKCTWKIFQDRLHVRPNKSQ